MKERNEKTAKAVEAAREEITTRPNDSQRSTLILIRPTTAKAVADGWTLAIQDRKGVSLLGEVQIAAFLAGADKTDKGEKAAGAAVADELRKITAKVKDLPHLLAAGWEICHATGFRPCRLLALCGPGAKAKCAEIDAAREKMGGYKSELKAAQGAFIEAVTEGKKADKLRARMQAAAKAIKDYSDEYEGICKSYKVTARAAVAVIANMADLRQAYTEK